jgi:hypothetical protein
VIFAGALFWFFFGQAKKNKEKLVLSLRLRASAVMFLYPRSVFSTLVS